MSTSLVVMLISALDELQSSDNVMAVCCNHVAMAVPIAYPHQAGNGTFMIYGGLSEECEV